MESLGTLAGGIAHDFNNLLMSILGNADLALQTREGSVEALLLDVKLAAQRASELTHQMLAYAGKGSFVYERTDINALVTELGGLLRSVISKRADLRFELAESLALVNCDPTQIRQVVMNLITNASDALEDRDGVITVATGIVDADMAQLESTILGKELTAGRYVTIVVTDTGVGMTKDVEVRIFDPFFTTKFTGRGLGMAAVVGILRSHKGTLRVQSEPGEGSSFSVLLPALSGPAPAFQAEFARAASEARGPRRGSASEALLKAAPVAAVLQPSAPLAPRSATPNPEKHGTILVADDEEPVLRVTQRILERAGYRVLLARDGEQALSIFREKMHEIDGVILDLTMPKLSGAEALREIRVLSPGARVLLASGYAEEDVLRRLVGVTTSHVLQKPCTPKVMLLKVAALLEDP
jgi:CheY-like chemotaxis protein